MRNSPQKITRCLDLFYRGISTRKVQEHLQAFYPHNVSNVSIYKWVIKYAENIKSIDVRDLEMPLPMVTILRELEKLPEDILLYVNHKKVPEFLLPELQERGYKWMIEEIEEGNVKLLIYK